MIENLRLNGGKPPDYVYVGFIAKMFDKSESFIYQLGILNNVRYIVCSRYRKKYNLNDVLREAKRYKIDPPNRDHPDAKLRPNEIVARLDINGHTYIRLAKKLGWIKEHTDEFGQYVLLSDYDWFVRNFYIPALLQFAPERMRVCEVAELFGVKKDTIYNHLRVGDLKCGYGKRNIKYFTKDHIRAFIDTENGKVHYRFRRKPFDDKIKRCVAVMYMQHNPGWFDHKTDMHVINCVRDEHGRSLGYDKNALDKYYMHLWRYRAYGDSLPYYNRTQIKNKYGKTDLWVDTFIKGKCRCYLTQDKLLTPSEYDEYAKQFSAKYANILTRGWVKEDVDRIVQSGVDIKPKIEIRKLKKEYNKTDKKVRKAIGAAVSAGLMKKYEPQIDPIELAFQTIMQKRKLESEERHRIRNEQYRKVVAERNVIRAALNLTPNYDPHLSASTILKVSETPEVVFILYSRNADCAKMFAKYAPFEMPCTYNVRDTVQVSNHKAQFTVFKSISRAANNIAIIPPRTIPSWIVLASTSSIISDINFLQKLNSVPMDYGAVGPFGYKNLLPDNSWVKSNETYGLYTVYDNDNYTSRHVVGTLGYDSPNEVAVLGGPFIAIRGSHLNVLQSIQKYRDFGDGQLFLSALISFIFRRLSIKLLQIPVDCSMVRHDDIKIGSLEWNKAEESLRKIDSIAYGDLLTK